MPISVTPSDIAKFRYNATESLIEIEGYIQMCNHKFNQMLRTKNGLTEDAPAFYAVLMFNRGSGQERHIHFRFDFRDVLYYMESSEEPADENGAFKYKCIFFPDAKFIYFKDGYPALEGWKDGTIIEENLIIEDKKFAHWTDIRDNQDEFRSTRDHSNNFYNCPQRATN